jgi:hypothetical protein
MGGGRVIADTNVVSYLMKGTELGQRFKPHLAGKIVGIAFVTVAEMHYGAESQRSTLAWLWSVSAQAGRSAGQTPGSQRRPSGMTFHSSRTTATSQACRD